MATQVKTRQFQTAAQRRTFFDRKVLKYGYSRTIALGKVVPEEWQYVRVRVLDKNSSRITIELTKLLGSEPLAQNKKPDSTDRQDT
jgi:hypothetical protein